MTKQRFWLGVQVIVTFVLLALLFKRFDWQAFREVVGRLSPAFYLGSLVAFVAGQLLYALRWRVVLAGMGIHVRYGEVVQQYLIGVFFGNLMPSAVGGDAAKVYYLGQRAGYVEVGASVFVDRFLGFLWLSIIGSTIAWLVDAPTPIFLLNRNLLTLFAIMFLTLLAAAWLVPADRVIPARVRTGRFAAIAARVETFLAHVRAGGCKPATLLTAAAVVLVYQLLMTVVYLRFFAASGATVPGALSVLNILVSMSVFINVPISVNGIGLREQLHALLFASLGVAREVSVSVSLLVFSHSLLLSVVGYGVWLRARPAAAGSPA